MSPQQIADERRRGRLAAVAAVAAAALFVAAAIWSQSLSSDSPTRNRPAELRYFNRHAGELIGSWTLRGLAFLLLVAVTLHLYRATKARRPEEPRVVLVMGLYGPLAAGVGTIVVAIALAVAASHFADRSFQTIDAADDAVRFVQLLSLLIASGSFALAFWFIKGCLDAIRVGLLNRPVGVVGMIIGPGLILASGPFQFVLMLWLLAVATVFAGIALRELPPAWEAGEAVALPSARERLGEALDDGLRTTPNGEVEAVGPGVRSAGEAERAAGGARRKRKRRR
jgi:Domain of unknown function (DUF4386)